MESCKTKWTVLSQWMMYNTACKERVEQRMVYEKSRIYAFPMVAPVLKMKVIAFAS